MFWEHWQTQCVVLADLSRRYEACYSTTKVKEAIEAGFPMSLLIAPASWAPRVDYCVHFRTLRG